MTVYVIAMMKVTDEARYRDFQARFKEEFWDSGGRIVAADGEPMLLEGDRGIDRVVIMQFVSAEQARLFYERPAYREMADIRRTVTDSTVVLVRGLA